MRVSSIIAAALSVASVNASVNALYSNGTEYGNGTWTTTEVVTQYTTYCPYATTIVENNQTYIVTEPTTLTITNCPCTRTLTYTTVTETHCPGGCHKPTDSPIYPNSTTTTPTTADAVYPPPSETPDYPSPNITRPPASEGAAASNKATLVGGFVVGLVGVAAYLL